MTQKILTQASLVFADIHGVIDLAQEDLSDRVHAEQISKAIDFASVCTQEHPHASTPANIPRSSAKCKLSSETALQHANTHIVHRHRMRISKRSVTSRGPESRSPDATCFCYSASPGGLEGGDGVARASSTDGGLRGPRPTSSPSSKSPRQIAHVPPSSSPSAAAAA